MEYDLNTEIELMSKEFKRMIKILNCRIGKPFELYDVMHIFYEDYAHYDTCYIQGIIHCFIINGYIGIIKIRGEKRKIALYEIIKEIPNI